MKHHTMHKLAKFASGLIAADFLILVWLATNNMLPVTLVGITITQSMVFPALVFDAVLFFILVHYGWRIRRMPILHERKYLLFAGSIFGIVAVLHFARIFTGSALIVFSWTVPMWLSWVGVAITAYLSYMSFRLISHK